MGEQTPKGMWEKLESVYASKSVTNKLILKLDLYSLKMDEGMSIHKHLSDFNRVLTKVLNTGEKVGDEEQAILLLSSLPVSYKSLVQSLTTRNTSLKKKDVTTFLIDNEKLLGVEKMNSSDRLYFRKAIEKTGSTR